MCCSSRKWRLAVKARENDSLRGNRALLAVLILQGIGRQISTRDNVREAFAQSLISLTLGGQSMSDRFFRFFCRLT